MLMPPLSSEIPLFRMFPGLRVLPRLELTALPTPVQPLPQVSAELGCFHLWIKRDDLTGTVYGGNKPRKYEFMLGDAQKKGKTHIITIGGIGSNHALANTLFCKRLGWESYIYLFDQPLTQHVRNVLRCDIAQGAHLKYTGSYLKTGLAVIKQMLTDRHAYFIWAGASVPRGTVGYVNAALELAEQIKRHEIPEPDHLFVAVGSTGTCAGLTLGCELAGLKTKIHGIAVSDKIVTNKKQVLKLARKTNQFLRSIDKSVPDVASRLADRVDVSFEYFGGQYGRATHEGLEAIELAKRDGITLDFTYTGKTFSGLIGYCRDHPHACEEVLLYWHTLNSVDLSPLYCEMEMADMPPALQCFFDGSRPLDENPVYARQRGV
jgi:D-cysteine desulfhydrase